MFCARIASVFPPIEAQPQVADVQYLDKLRRSGGKKRKRWEKGNYFIDCHSAFSPTSNQTQCGKHPQTRTNFHFCPFAPFFHVAPFYHRLPFGPNSKEKKQHQTRQFPHPHILLPFLRLLPFLPFLPCPPIPPFLPIRPTQPPPILEVDEAGSGGPRRGRRSALNAKHGSYGIGPIFNIIEDTSRRNNRKGNFLDSAFVGV